MKRKHLLFSLSTVLALSLCAYLTACSNDGLPPEAIIPVTPEQKAGNNVTSPSETTGVNSNPPSEAEVVSGSFPVGITEMEVSPDKDKLHLLVEPDSSETIEIYTDTFIDDDGTEYMFRKGTGEYVGFIRSPDLFGEGLMITEEEAQVIADGVAAAFADISKYSLREHKPDGGYDGDGNLNIYWYDFTYSRVIGGYRAKEGISVMLLYDGTVMSVIMENIGKFDGLEVPMIDEAELDRRFLEEARKQYGNIEVKEIMTRILDYDGSRFVMDYFFRYTDLDITDHYTEWVEYILIPV